MPKGASIAPLANLAFRMKGINRAYDLVVVQGLNTGNTGLFEHIENRSSKVAIIDMQVRNVRLNILQKMAQHERGMPRVDEVDYITDPRMPEVHRLYKRGGIIRSYISGILS